MRKGGGGSMIRILKLILRAIFVTIVFPPVIIALGLAYLFVKIFELGDINDKDNDEKIF